MPEKGVYYYMIVQVDLANSYSIIIIIPCMDAFPHIVNSLQVRALA